MLDISKMSPRDLFDLKERLSRMKVFGPWTQANVFHFVRPEPGRGLNDSRVSVWLKVPYEEKDPLKPGWYFRLGFGVLDLFGVSGTKPFKDAKDCMARVDELLKRDSSNYLVEEHAAETWPVRRMLAHKPRMAT